MAPLDESSLSAAKCVHISVSKEECCPYVQIRLKVINLKLLVKVEVNTTSFNISKKCHGHNKGFNNIVRLKRCFCSKNKP